MRDSLDAAKCRVAKKRFELEAKRKQVAQSQAQGHGKRLEQRQRAAAELEGKLREAEQHASHLQEQVNSFEAPQERGDRDFRKQTIMTIRTLFLENLLQSFMSMLLSVLPKQVSLEQVLKLLFERSGSRIERDKTVMYWILTVESSRPFWPVWKASDFQVVEKKGLKDTGHREAWIFKIFQNQILRRTFDCQDWINTTGLSRGNRRRLGEIVEGLSAMGLGCVSGIVRSSG